MSATILLCWVLFVSDGDSLTVRCHSQDKLRVRIASIDSPERRQAFGGQARQQLVRLCQRQLAQIDPVGEDRYGRTLAQVRCSGQDAASAQVANGLAWVYPPVAQQYPDLVALERQARQQRLGLWSQPRPQPPWKYRQQHPPAAFSPKAYNSSARNCAADLGDNIPGGTSNTVLQPNWPLSRMRCTARA